MPTMHIAPVNEVLLSSSFSRRSAEFPPATRTTTSVGGAAGSANTSLGPINKLITQALLPYVYTLSPLSYTVLSCPVILY